MKIRRRISVIALLALWLCFGAVNAFAATDTGDIGGRIERFVAEHSDTTAGMAVAVFDSEKSLYTGCFGFTDSSFTVRVESVEDPAVFHLPGGVLRVEDEAFRGDPLLTGVLLPEGIRELGDHILEDCPRLTKLALPASLTDIGENGFSGAVLLCSVGSAAADYAVGRGLPYILTR